MSPILLAGTIIVNLALVFYSIGIFLEQKHRVATPRVLMFLTAGVLFDIVATACMITGSTQSPFSLHGILGYSSLTGMLIETGLVWRHSLRYGTLVVPGNLHLYSRAAYIWWVLAYLTGALLILLRRS